MTDRSTVIRQIQFRVRRIEGGVAGNAVINSAVLLCYAYESELNGLPDAFSICSHLKSKGLLPDEQLLISGCTVDNDSALSTRLNRHLIKLYDVAYSLAKFDVANGTLLK